MCIRDRAATMRTRSRCGAGVDWFRPAEPPRICPRASTVPMNRVLESPPVEPIDRPQPDPATTAAANLEGAGPAPEISMRPSPATGRPRPSRWRHLLPAGLALLVILGTVLAGAALVTPPVTGAPALVAAIDLSLIHI